MEQTLKVSDVKSQDVEALWPLVKTYLAKALAKSQQEYAIADIYHALVQGEMKLWIQYEGQTVVTCAVCQIIYYPRKKSCVIILMAGEENREGGDYMKALPSIEDWARDLGANSIMAFTRKAVARKLKPSGYKETYTVVEKNLIDRRFH